MAGQRIGYIRVSSLDQNTQRQLEGVQLDRTFTDKASGKDTKRPQVEELLRFIRDGDTLLVHSMDRLARNLDDLRSLVQKGGSDRIRQENTWSSRGRNPHWRT
jgi:DNA invertase Pin-like site-specific DNA recombinase